MGPLIFGLNLSFLSLMRPGAGHFGRVASAEGPVWAEWQASWAPGEAQKNPFCPHQCLHHYRHQAA